MEFKKISKADWKAKIEKELRGKKPLNALTYKIGDEAEIDVLLQHEDQTLNKGLSTYPDNTSFGAYFLDHPSNNHLLHALNKGGSSIYLKDLNDNILKGVNTQYIDLILNPSSEIENRDLGLNIDRTFYLPEEQIINTTQLLKTGNLMKRIAYVLGSGSNIGLFMTDAILLNIALLRAIRSLMEEKKINGSIVTMVSFGDETLEYQLIRMTSQAMSAFTGGSDYVLFPIDGKWPLSDVTKVMHISNILNMESHISRQIDPWKGAYVIEKLTETIVDKVKKGGL